MKSPRPAWVSKIRPVRFATILICMVSGAFFDLILREDNFADGLLYDSAVAVSGLLSNEVAAQDPVAVILIDAPSLASKELKPYPRALFGPVWREFLDVAFAHEARVVALDALLSFSGDQFEDDYDRMFLDTLETNRDSIVLGRSLSRLPAAPYLAAMGANEAALGVLQLEADDDGVTRRAVSRLASEEEGKLPTLAASALSRFGVKELPENFRLKPSRHVTSIPYYSLIGVLRCSRTASAHVREVLQGRILFVGTALPDEERKISSGRFLPRPPPSETALGGCNRIRPTNVSAGPGASVPGVFLHAEIAREVIAGHLVQPLALGTQTVITIIAAALSAAIGLYAIFSLVSLTIVVGVAALYALEVWFLQNDLWFAGTAPISVFIFAAIASYLVRYFSEGRRRLRVERAFDHFLAPGIVSQLAKSRGSPKVGGEACEITVMFADLSGFSALANRVGADELVEITNNYFERLVDAIDASGGYVDKFIGDTVIAFWGAPQRDERHAFNAVAAALAIRDDIAATLNAADRSGKTGFDIKIGLYSGQAVVGNMGTRRRMNFTAVGEAVDMVLRLEELPRRYGVRIVMGESTAQLVAAEYFMRKLDTITVRDRAGPLSIYEPLAPSGAVPNDVRQLAAAYEKALDQYQYGNMVEAWEVLSAQAERDPAAAIMAERCAGLIRQPPEDDWDGVWRYSEK